MNEMEGTREAPPCDRTQTFVSPLRRDEAQDALAALQAPRNYEDGEVHAQGGMGAILRTRDRKISRTVAMKVMQRGAASPQDVLRFIDEARITGRLEHPNIVPVHEVGVNGRGEVFYTMKFVKGTTLKQVLDAIAAGDAATRERYPLAALVTVFQKVCDAVAFAHSRGVIHRDLKPENVMLGDYGEVLLMDWGLAKVLGQPEHHHACVPPSSPAHSLITSARDDSDGSGTQVGTVLGTPRYMAPEQAAGSVAQVGKRSDIYALGAILYEILALRPVVAGQSTEAILANVAAGRIEPLPETGIPGSLAAVARKALSLRPDDRYASVPELQSEISRYQIGFATTAEKAGFGKQLALLIRRNKGIAATAAVAWVVITALAVWFVVRVTEERNAATSERDRAEEALAGLRAAAPTYLAEARTLFAGQKADEALDKIDIAIRLAPDDADAHLLRGQKLQVLERLPEAAESFRRVLALRPYDASAAANLELCEGLLKENPGAASSAPTNRAKLLAAVAQQGRSEDLWPLQRATGRNQAATRALLESRIRPWMAQPAWERESGGTAARIKELDDGTFELNLERVTVGDLSPLRGLPISRLNLKGQEALTDLSPLVGMPLVWLHLGRARSVTHVRALAGLPLEWLDLRETRVSDLSPLAECKRMKFLHFGFAPVSDLSPIAGLPLRAILADGTPVRDVSPLASIGTLETILLPNEGNTAGVDKLRNLSNLRRISYRWNNGKGDVAQSTEEFWAEYDAAKK
jgi:tRNA A-37 threonylcarbamoyl transferase component Bud32/tetratricopeptide (TPR) repeat protein